MLSIRPHLHVQLQPFDGSLPGADPPVPRMVAPNPQLLDPLGFSPNTLQLSLRTLPWPQQSGGGGQQEASSAPSCPHPSILPTSQTGPGGLSGRHQGDQAPSWCCLVGQLPQLSYVWAFVGPLLRPPATCCCHCHSGTMRPQSLPCLGPGSQVGQMMMPRALPAQAPALGVASAIPALGPCPACRGSAG